jgi:hypothetical protein
MTTAHRGPKRGLEVFMVESSAFPSPKKIHFTGIKGEDVGAVFADRIVPHGGGFTFYLGGRCVAILSEEFLMIGPRQIKRSVLSSKKPFWHNQ